MVKASLIISFYNRIDYLNLILAGLERQSFKDFEIIIADDGSSREVIKEIELISEKIPYQIIHVWQEDKGFRKNKILNRAIVSSNSDYLIFIDGDCIPHSEFINEHYKSRSEGLCLTGRRVNLSSKITNILTPEKVKEGYLDKNSLLLFFDGLFGKSVDVEKGFYFKNSFLRNFFNKKKRGMLGSNFSIHKKNILEINGFDERYEAPSIGEDTDIQYRLELKGIGIKSLNNIAVQYHLFHKLQPRDPKNLKIFEGVKEQKNFFTPYGIYRK
jgi:glycosyltransferase involved in cell wall biosynthesis